MRKIILSILLLVSFSTVYANVKLAGRPIDPFIGKPYVGEILANSIAVKDEMGQQKILIVTKSYDKFNESKIPGVVLSIDGKDFPYGLMLGSLIKQKIAVIFANANYDIAYIEVITDKYWKPENRLSANNF